MTSENRERLMDLLHLGKLAERAHVQRLPDDVVDFFVAKIEELGLRRRAAHSFTGDYHESAAALERLDELVQSIHDTVAAYDSEGLGTWQSDFDRWHAARAVKH
jgi:hypothetical protein